MTVLILAENKKGALVKPSLGAINFGMQLAEKMGCGYSIAVIGKGVDAAVDAVKGYGAEKIYKVDDAGLENYMDELWSAAFVQVAEKAGAKACIGLTTTQGKAVMPRVAAKFGAGMASDCIGLNSDSRFIRPVFAGNLNAEVEITTEAKVVTVRTTFDQAQPKGGESPVEDVAVELPAMKKEFVAFDEAKSDRPPLTEANIVVSGGRGLKNAEGFEKVIYPFADSLGAAVGATRAVVDAGFVENEFQVGQTGKVVAPKLYFAIGLSGAIQHLAGMKDSKTIVAINKDEEAPIFSVADYGLVADLFEVVPELHEKLKAAK